MRLGRLSLRDYRSYEHAELELADGLTVLLGPNGQGKTNLVEAIGWLATMGSFRGAPTEALVRRGADRAIVRAQILDEQREQLIEAEIVPSGRSRVLVNRQPLKRSRDLVGTIRATVFAPDDLELVKGGPSMRRGFLDAVLVSLHPKHDRLQRDLDRVLRQRGALLRSAGGRLDESAAFTLDVWDEKLVEAATPLVEARVELVRRLNPIVTDLYHRVAGAAPPIRLSYRSGWFDDGLANALVEARRDDVKRGVNTVGPHRDDLDIDLNELPSRTHASQGEQRSLALALRLAGHALVTEETGSAPVLLLDDVFSELDESRARALVEALPSGQTLLTSASELPPGAVPEALYRVGDGTIERAMLSP